MAGDAIEEKFLCIKEPNQMVCVALSLSTTADRFHFAHFGFEFRPVTIQPAFKVDFYDFLKYNKDAHVFPCQVLLICS